MPKCHVCSSGEFHPELVDEVFQINNQFYLVQQIPAQVCSRCGEIIFSRETTEKIRKMLQGEAQPVKSIQVEVFAYSNN